METNLTQSESPQNEKSEYEKLLEILSTSGLFQSFSSNNQLLEYLKNELASIEKGISIDGDAIDTNGFLKHNVDILLDQAANLLDRGIRDRDQWDNLSLNQFETILNSKLFLDFDETRKREFETTRYLTDVSETTLLKGISDLNLPLTENLKTEFEKLYNEKWNDNAIEAIIEEHATLARLGSKGNPDINPTEIYNTAKKIQQYEFAVQKIYNQIQNDNLGKSYEIENLYQIFYNEKQRIDFFKILLRKGREDIDRKYEALRLSSIQDPNGVLNFQKRMKPLKERFENDFKEAYARQKAASEGLLEIFGYQKNLPDNFNDVDFFDKCVTWNRDAINWLIRFSRLDQSFVKTISLRSQNSSNSFDLVDTWQQFLSTGILKFNLKKEALNDYQYVRLKGLSIFIEYDNPVNASGAEFSYHNEGMITCKIKPPKNSYYIHSDNIEHFVVQELPILRLSRIARRNFIRNPEVIGTTILSNASPFGEWELTFPQTIEESLSADINIKGIHIDFFITARHVQAV